VPVYILGSSLFGASLAAHFGLPYAFASHFAPEALQEAVAVYRSNFRPSQHLDQPRVLAAVNVICADTDDDADRQLQIAARWRVQRFLNVPETVHDGELDRLMTTPQGQHILRMMTYSAVGSPAVVRQYLDDFAAHADADELIVALASPTTPERLRSLELVAEAAGITTPVGAP
jgi:luciferase family oxidoreductase group 1